MLISLTWLREYVDIPETAEKLAEDLTMLGLNVEGVEHKPNPLAEFVVGRVVERVQHPDADKLSVCQVDVGDGILRNIVCGAPNVREGLTVSVILPGKHLPDGMKIKKAKLRGVKSEGMICSEIEMGLGGDASGILELDDEKKPGTALSDYFGREDWILDVEVTPNRPDQLGHIGIAREVAALYERELKLPQAEISDELLYDGPLFPVDVQDAVGCPRYIARYMDGIKIGPSPTWLCERLEAIGLRPINNVVDITNYVLHETGHPLHAFDKSLLAGENIVVRRANAGEKTITLDDEKIELRESDLVIADSQNTVAIAGVMGCQNSSVSESTNAIVLESAYFDPSGVRKTRGAHDLSTDSSYRFERDADIEMAEFASRRASTLILQLAGGRLSRQVNDVYPKPRETKTIELSPQTIRKVLGREFPKEEIRDLLERFDLKSEIEEHFVKVTIPSFRRDLDLEIDLVEEVARLYGFENLPMENRISNQLSASRSPEEKLMEKMHSIVTGLGFTEVMTSSFMDPRELDRMKLSPDDSRRSIVTVSNPLVSFNEKMRSSLLPGMLDVMKVNFHRGEDQVRIYQIGRVYIAREGEKLPNEPKRLSILMAGNRNPAHWTGGASELEEGDLAGIAISILEGLQIPVRVDYSSDEPFLTPGKCFRFFHAEKKEFLAQGGPLRKAMIEDIKGASTAFFLEFEIEKIVALSSGHALYRPLPAFPALKRDLALLLPEALRWENLSSVLENNGGKWLESVELFDVYSGDGIPEGTKSYAVRLKFRSNDGTLTDEKVDRQISRILKALKESLNVILRS
jgi:phenylalanyl-tRNA synthetase beta chain